MKSRPILNSQQIDLTITRLCFQLIEVHNDFSDTVILGIQPRGIHLAHRIHKKLSDILNKKEVRKDGGMDDWRNGGMEEWRNTKTIQPSNHPTIQPSNHPIIQSSNHPNELLSNKEIKCGNLDITFYRDDFRKKELVPSSTEISFDIENKNVVLVDDVLYTGRTIRAALDAMLTLGRPKDVELVTLIDRRLSRHVPIQAKYIGKTIDSIASEKVLVHWKETDNKDEVILVTPALKGETSK